MTAAPVAVAGPAGASPPSASTYRRIWGFMGEFRGPVAGAVATSLGASVAFALLPWPIRYLIDDVLLSDRSARRGAGAALAYVGLQAVAALLMSWSFYLFARVALRMIHTLRGRMLAHLRALSLGYHASHSTGEMIFRSINDARSIQDVMIFGVQAWIMPVFQIALMVALMLALDPVLTAVAVAITPLLWWTIRRLTGRIQAASGQSRDHLAELTSLIEQTLGSMRAVQVFGRETDEHGRFEATSNRFIAAQLRFRLAEQSLSVATMLITGIGTAAVLWVAVQRVLSGAVTVGALWIFLSYMQRIYELLQRNLATFGLLQDSVVGVGRAFAVLDTPPAIVDRDGAVSLEAFRHSIVLDDVSLVYDRGPVLRGVSLTVPKGATVALVGPTGAGKTSLLNVVPRLYDVTGGAVRIDGHDVRHVQLSSLRDLVSMVPQEPLLFSGSVRQNIRYGRLDATDDEVVDAARRARAHEFITALADGYDTEVGDRGGRLSLGQQQRIALARAFLKDAPILLLDEPTAALDVATEAELITGMRTLMEGRTVVIVAHRLSTIRHADCIYVVEDGRVVEQGRHPELVARAGPYARLHRALAGA